MTTIDKDAVLEKALSIAGDISGMSGELLESLCALQLDRLLSELLPDRVDAGCAQALALAAGYLAAAGALSSGASGIQSFTAGELSIVSGDAEKAARTLRREAEALIARYTDTGNFHFEGVGL
ncbi:hypothetical protein LJC32_04915 [Oscillospiraceae bacterium OttesenSCG-928-F05]|nr:hypothetical protein [Oscillospiraceae bacterium OttesenSCG-928-F05]